MGRGLTASPFPQKRVTVKKEDDSVNTIRTSLLLLTASAAIFSGWLGTASVIGDAETTAQAAAAEKGLHIKLLSDDPGETEFDPGAEIPVNIRVENEGTEDARVFIKVEVPEATGAILTDGTEDPEVLEFTPGEGWSEIEDGAYYYEDLLSSGESTESLISSWTIPHYDLSFNEDGEIASGSVPVEELGAMMNSVDIRGYSIMDTKGTPEQLWRMVGGE